MDDDKGTSLILVNTDKGEKYWSDISAALTVVSSDYDDAARINPALVKSPVPHRNRARFFNVACKAKDFDVIAVKLLMLPLMNRIKARIKRILKRALGK